MPPTMAGVDQQQQLSNQKSYVVDQKSHNEMTSEEESQKRKVEREERVLPQNTDNTGMYVCIPIIYIYVPYKSTK